MALNGDGSTLAVGAPGESSAAKGVGGLQTDISAPNAGAAYVFTRSATTWSQQAYVKASNTDASDYFGDSVALSTDGNTLAVGADGEDSASKGIGGIQTDNTAPDSGAVYVYTRAGSAWSQQAYIKSSNPETSDIFGDPVALSADGNTLAVAAAGESSAAQGIAGSQSDNAAESAGAVYVYTRSGSTWSSRAYVKASNTEATDYFSASVALSADGNTLAVGADGEDSSAMGISGNQTSNAAARAGAVYLY